MNKSRLQSQKGQVLIGLVVVIALVIVIEGAQLLASLNQFNVEMKRTIAESTAQLIRKNIQTAIEDPDVWSALKDQFLAVVPAPIFPFCLASCTCPALGVGVSLQSQIPQRRFSIPSLSPQSITLFYDSTVVQGFNSSGEPCIPAAASGDDLCPFQVTLYWDQDMSINGCTGSPPVPLVDIYVDIAYKPQHNSFVLNTTSANYAQWLAADVNTTKNAYILKRLY